MSNASAMEYAEGLAETLRTETVDTVPDIGEYLESVLDYRLTYNSRKELFSVSLLVAFGGPTAWVTFDGDNATVEAHWYSDTQTVFVPNAPLSGPVFDYFDEVMAIA